MSSEKREAVEEEGEDAASEGEVDSMDAGEGGERSASAEDEGEAE